MVSSQAVVRFNESVGRWYTITGDLPAWLVNAMATTGMGTVIAPEQTTLTLVGMVKVEKAPIKIGNTPGASTIEVRQTKKKMVITIPQGAECRMFLAGRSQKERMKGGFFISNVIRGSVDEYRQLLVQATFHNDGRVRIEPYTSNGRYHIILKGREFSVVVID